MLKHRDWNHLSAIRVILLPGTGEGLEAIVADPDLLLGRRGGEALQNNSNEEVEEDEADHHDEGHEVEVGRRVTAALNTILHLRLVGLVVDALK